MNKMEIRNIFNKKLSMFTKLDLFGYKYMFEEDNSQSYKTRVGAFFTFILYISVIVLGFLFGKEIYQRKSPYLMKSDEFTTSDNYTKLNIRKFPFIFNLQNANGLSLENINSLFNIKVKFFSLLDSALIMKDYYGFVKCNPLDYDVSVQKRMTEIVESNSNKNWDSFCINHKGTEDFEIYNPFVYSPSCGVSISIEECDEHLRDNPTFPYENNPTNLPACSENRKEIIEAYIFRTTIIDSFFNYKNQNSPEVEYSKSWNVMLGYGLQTTVTYEVSKEVLKSDDGWILEAVKDHEIMFLNKQNYEISKSGSKNIMLYYNISTSSQIIVSNRSYLKVQELFAKVGGLFNGIFLLMHLIITNYVKFKYRINFSHYLIEEDASISKDLLDLNIDSSISPQKLNLSISKHKMNDFPEDNIGESNINKLEEKNNENYNSIQNQSNVQAIKTENKEKINDFLKENKQTNQKNPQNIEIRDLNTNLKSKRICKNNFIYENNSPQKSKSGKKIISNIIETKSIQSIVREEIINFEDDEKKKEVKNILIKFLNNLSYLVYVKEKIMNFICFCQGKQKLSLEKKCILLVDNEIMSSIYSFDYYLNFVNKFKNFENNLTKAKNY